MRIGQTLGVSTLVSRARAARRVEPGSRADEAGREPGRALVPVAMAASEPETESRMVRHRVEAPFLAQLIAAHRDLPEQRRYHRLAPGPATAIYAKAERGEGLLVPGYLVDVAR